MNQKILNKIFVWGFLFLYLLVACISFCHAIQFFNIGNLPWMSVTLAFAFELGLALSLAAILLSDKNKANTLPWILMIVLCAVQVIGNVYSTFKFISESGQDYYQYLAKPLLFFIEEVDENTIQVIVSWIIGAILPIIALMMTDMVATNLKHTHDDTAEELPIHNDTSNNINTTQVLSSPLQESISDENSITQESAAEDDNPISNDDDISEYVDDPVFNTKNIEAESTEKENVDINKDSTPTVIVPKQQQIAQQNTNKSFKVEPIVNDVIRESKHSADEYYFKSPMVNK